MTDLLPRVPVLEWSRQSATGGLKGLSWVDTTPVDASRPFVVVPTEAGPTFRHVPYGGFLPPSMLHAAQDAHADGVPTALDGLQIMFATSEWLVAAREHLWTTHTPVPALLPELVEAYGLDQSLHHNHSETLSVLLAHAPQWYPRRGHADRALEMMRAADVRADALTLDEPAQATEAFACHDAQWWRMHGGAHGDLTLRAAGAVIPSEQRADTSSEDVVLTVSPQHPFPHELLRLLPAWASVRLLTPVAS